MNSDDDVPDLQPLVADCQEQQDASRWTPTKDCGMNTTPPVEYNTCIEPVPVLLLTGYLGSGKTTLVNHILTAKHGYRCAVLLNEIGDTADIEKALIKEPDDQEASPLTDWVELENGCICCSVKNEMVKALESLLQQRTRFDYIIIETTGLANPGPVASALWTDAELESSLCLDAIVTVVDAAHITKHMNTPNEELGEANEAQRQIAFADVILLNKVDLVDASILAGVREKIHNINMDAKIIESIRCNIDLGDILHTGIYSQGTTSLVQEKIGGHVCSDVCDHGVHSHDLHEIHTCTFYCDEPIEMNVFREWLDEFLWEKQDESQEVYRVKGLICVHDSNKKFILQAVHELYDIFEGKEWGKEEQKRSKFVFIGKNLNEGKIREELSSIQQSQH